MEIFDVTSEEFKEYGKVLDGYNTQELLDIMKKYDLPSSGTIYQASIPELEYCSIFGQFQNNQYGGMPIQIGMCWGKNTKLNCLEYHRDSEINCGTHDFVLLLAKQSEIENGSIDSSKVKAFKVKAGTAVEVYATTLHYAPCHTNEKDGFHVLVVLPKGTNTEKPDIKNTNKEDELLLARNKWLIAHKDSDEAKQGAYVGITGENIDLNNN